MSKFRNLAAPLSNVLKTTTSAQKTSLQCMAVPKTALQCIAVQKTALQCIAVHSSAVLQCKSIRGDTERKKLEKKFEEDIARDFDWRQPGLIITLVPPIKKEWVDKICDKAASLDIEVNKELVRSNIDKQFYNKTYSYMCS